MVSTILHTYLCVFSVTVGLVLVTSRFLGFCLVFRVSGGQEIDTFLLQTPWAFALGLGLLSAGLACW